MPESLPWRPISENPHMSFQRGLCPRTEFFTLENLPSRMERCKSNMTAPLVEQRFQQAQANYSRWENGEKLLKLSEIDFVYPHKIV